MPRRWRAGSDHNINEIDVAFWTFPPDYERRLPAVVGELGAIR